MIIVGCLNARTSKSLFTKLQRFVTGKNVTHSFLLLDKYYGDFQMLDARTIVTLDPFKNINHEGNDIWLYKLDFNKKDTEIIEQIMYEKFIGKSYGYFQLIWFVWRRLNELIFKRNMKNKPNWFNNGILCSEIVWYTLTTCKIVDFKSGNKKYEKLNDFLSKYNSDSFHSGDCKELLDDLVENKIIERLQIEELMLL